MPVEARAGRARRLMPVAISLAGLVVICAIAWGAWELGMELRFSPSPPPADFPPAQDRLEARQQDIAYFRHYLHLDRSYTGATREEARAVLAELSSRLDELSDAAFELGIARAVARADNGHSNIWLGRFSRKHGRLPIHLFWFADGLFVTGAESAHADLLGLRLTHVGDYSVEQAAAQLRQFVGGTQEAFRAYRGPVLFEVPAAHHAAGLSTSETRVRLRFEAADGHSVERQLSALPLTEDAVLFWPAGYLLEPPLVEGRYRDWVWLADTLGTVPLYLQPGGDYQRHALPGDGLYLQYRNNRGEGIEAFGERVRRELADQKPAFLVVDQRFNGGGDYTLTADLMSDLPALAGSETPIYVITGPQTFSAGINSVAFLRAAGRDRVTIIGERIGDRERMHGETNDFELPNSALGMTFNTGLHDVANGCPPFPQCYWINYFYDVAVGSLDPDITVVTRSTDYLAGRDPVLEAILQRQQFAPRAAL